MFEHKNNYIYFISTSSLLLIITTLLSGCSFNNYLTNFEKENKNIYEKQTTNLPGYQEFKLKKPIEFTVDQEMKTLNNYEELLGETSEELISPTYQYTYGDPSVFGGSYSYQNKKYFTKNGSGGNTVKVYNAKTNKLLLNTDLCSIGSREAITKVREVQNYISVDFLQNCNQKKMTVVENIFYQGKTINEQYKVKGSKELFIYKNKVGFIEMKDNKEYIYFNNKRISPAFDTINNHACCAMPAYFKLYQNGALQFLAQKEKENYIVEIDLNKYL
jgi:hypothetical protein